MRPGSPASATPPKSSAPAFARSAPLPRTPAPPPAPDRAKSDFAACDPYFPMLCRPALHTSRDARAHPLGAIFLLLVRGLLDPSQDGAKTLHSNKSSAAFSRFLAGVVYPAPCFPLTHWPDRPSLILK